MIIDSYKKYLKKYINQKFIFFGQNITYGSRITGLTDKIEKITNTKCYNTQNSENSLIGFGLGIMLKGKNSIYFAKQLDFILLGIDHLVNTLNYIIFKKKIGSFSIITYIVDSGFEGPQSRFHCLKELSSMSLVDCNYLVFPSDIAITLKKIKKKGFKIFCLSQRHRSLNENPVLIKQYKNQNIFQYKQGNKGTIIAFGFSAYKALEIIKLKKLDVDFFVVTSPLQKFSKTIFKNFFCKRFLYIFDDSRSKIDNFGYFYDYALKYKKKTIIRAFLKKESIKNIYVNKDDYEVKI